MMIKASNKLALTRFLNKLRSKVFLKWLSYTSTLFELYWSGFSSGIELIEWTYINMGLLVWLYQL